MRSQATTAARRCDTMMTVRLPPSRTLCSTLASDPWSCGREGAAFSKIVQSFRVELDGRQSVTQHSASWQCCLVDCADQGMSAGVVLDSGTPELFGGVEILKSTSAEVASSHRSRRGRRTRAREMPIRCFSPPLTLSPLSPTWCRATSYIVYLITYLRNEDHHLLQRWRREGYVQQTAVHGLHSGGAWHTASGQTEPHLGGIAARHAD